jgi:hypothetical protein
MEYINLGAVIEQAIARFGQNRIGERPPVFLVGSSTLAGCALARPESQAICPAVSL